MKKVLRIVSVLIALYFTVSCVVFGDYSENGTPNDPAIEFIEDFANEISANSSFKVIGENVYRNEILDDLTREKIVEPDPNYTKYTVSDSFRLHSFTEGKSYIMYLLSPKGYAVYEEISGVAEEVMPGADNPFENILSGDFYYGGPMNFIVKNGNKYALLGSDSELTSSDISYIMSLERSTSEKRNSSKGAPEQNIYNYMTSYYYFSGLNGHFGDNNTSCCTQVACDIMLGFYDYFVNGQFVPTGYHYIDQLSGLREYGTKYYDKNYNDTFINYLKSFMGNGSITFSTAQTGLQNYFTAIMYSTPSVGKISSGHTAVYSKVSSNVANNKPTVIGMSTSYNPSCPLDHAVVAYGTKEVITLSSYSKYYYVHTGWKNPNPSTGTYAYDWFGEALYIY